MKKRKIVLIVSSALLFLSSCGEITTSDKSSVSDISSTTSEEKSEEMTTTDEVTATPTTSEPPVQGIDGITFDDVISKVEELAEKVKGYTSYNNMYSVTSDNMYSLISERYDVTYHSNKILRTVHKGKYFEKVALDTPLDDVEFDAASISERYIKDNIFYDVEGDVSEKTYQRYQVDSLHDEALMSKTPKLNVLNTNEFMTNGKKIVERIIKQHPGTDYKMEFVKNDDETYSLKANLKIPESEYFRAVHNIYYINLTKDKTISTIGLDSLRYDKETGEITVIVKNFIKDFYVDDSDFDKNDLIDLTTARENGQLERDNTPFDMSKLTEAKIKTEDIYGLVKSIIPYTKKATRSTLVGKSIDDEYTYDVNEEYNLYLPEIMVMKGSKTISDTSTMSKFDENALPTISDSVVVTSSIIDGFASIKSVSTNKTSDLYRDSENSVMTVYGRNFVPIFANFQSYRYIYSSKIHIDLKNTFKYFNPENVELANFDLNSKIATIESKPSLGTSFKATFKENKVISLEVINVPTGASGKVKSLYNFFYDSLKELPTI